MLTLVLQTTIHITSKINGLVLKLGDSPFVRFRFALCRLGMAPLLDATAQFQLKLKRTVKKMLKRGR